MKRIFSLLICTILLLHPANVLAATLSLSPASGTFNKGCTFSLNINLDTQGTQTDGTDAILLYDASRLTATNVASGTIYPDYPGNNIDTQNGKITISGLASVSTAFSGKGTLATINFSVPAQASTGLTQIKFDFDPYDKAKTTDSNVVERGTIVDVLNSVVNGNYTVGTGTCGTQTVTTTGSGTTFQGTVTSTPSSEIRETLPPAGSEKLTFTLTILGSVLTVLGILGLALL